MRILAVIRQVPDAEATIHVVDGRVDLGSVKPVIDTMDEYGVEEALRLREKLSGVEVVVLAVGHARSEGALRAALALGADRAILVETAEPLDVLATSTVVAQVAKREDVQLILCGGQQSDWDSQALGAATAEHLGWPQVTWATSLSIEEPLVIATHDIEEGRENIECMLPAVITTQQGLNEPRYPTLPNIMKARKKELKWVFLEEFSTRSLVKVVSAAILVKERRRVLLDGKDASGSAGQIVDLLRHEAKVIA